MATSETINAIALYDFQADGENQLTISAGNHLIITDTNGEWGYGHIPNKSDPGWFPLNYVEISLPEKPVLKRPPPPPTAAKPRKSTSASKLPPPPPPQSTKPKLIPSDSSLLSELKTHVGKQKSERQIGCMSHNRNKNGSDIIAIVQTIDEKTMLPSIYQLLIDTLIDLPNVKQMVEISSECNDVVKALSKTPPPLLIKNTALFYEIITNIDSNSSDLISTFLEILYNKIDRKLNPEKYEGMFRGGSKYSKKRKSKSKKNKIQVKNKTRKL
jgi:hypothetical protein